MGSADYSGNIGTGYSTTSTQLGSYGLGGLASSQQTTIWPQQTLTYPQTITLVPPTEEKKVMARIIKYTVINPNPYLAKTSPEHVIIASGTTAVSGDGTDYGGFLLELGSKLDLTSHNAILAGLAYLDKDGDEHKFQPVKLSHLKVKIEVVDTIKEE